jgi:hypothetical protein
MANAAVLPVLVLAVIESDSDKQMTFHFHRGTYTVKRSFIYIYIYRQIHIHIKKEPYHKLDRTEEGYQVLVVVMWPIQFTTEGFPN